MTSKPWSFWRRHAAELGIELITVGTQKFARAADVLAAIERRSKSATTVADDDVEDEIAAMRRRVARAG